MEASSSSVLADVQKVTIGTHIWYAECLTRMGEFDKAEAVCRRALSLDPLSARAYNHYALLLWRARRYDEAVCEAQRALEIDSHYVNALRWQGLALGGKGRFAPAIECLQRAVERSPIPMSLGYLGHVLGLAGERTAASDILRKLAELQSRQYVSPVDFAVVEAGLGNGGAMFEWLETGCRSRASRVHELRTPLFDAVRTDPRYSNLLKRTGLIPQAPSSPPTT